nr:STY4851/ECs_5259 family protein [Lampropedia aestuarii]
MKFLNQRGLQYPDQRALYKYHCTEEEYHALRDVLKRSGPLDIALGSTPVCGALALFAAEWYRREYQRSDGWSWDPVFFGVNFYADPQARERLITSGLQKYWSRPVHRFDSDRRDFLGSLFGEGGLPFQLLREPGSPFQLLLKRLVQNHERAQQLGASMVEQVQGEVERLNLPQAFSRPVSLQMFAEMTNELVALVRDYGLDAVSDPVQMLTDSQPRWREQFPLPLDHQTGKDLLNGLLKTATIELKHQGARDAVMRLDCTHFWSEHRPERLLALISMPEKVRFILQTPPIAMRFDLTIVEGDEVLANLGPGYAFVNGLVAEVKLRQTKCEVLRRRPKARLYLAASVGGSVIARLPIANAPVLVEEQPMSLARDGGRWQLCGQASFSTASQEVMLVLPADCSPAQVSIEGELVAEVRQGPLCLGLQSVMLSGVGQALVRSDECYRIAVGQQQLQAAAIELEGQVVDWHSNPSLTFLGLPRVPDALQRAGAKLFIGGVAIEDAHPQELLGSQYAVVRDRDGHALMRRKVGILPTDLRIEFTAGETAGQATVAIHTQRACGTRIVSARLDARKATPPASGWTKWHLSCEGVPPPTFLLQLEPSLLGDPIHLELPFPALGCMLFDAEGDPVEKTLSLDQLLGTRLFLFGHPSVPKQFDIEFRLSGYAARNAHYAWSHKVLNQPVEVSVFSLRDHIEDLLSLQTGIDQEVQLNVKGNGRSVQYLIRRHSAVMKYEQNRERVVLESSALREGAYPEPALMLLHNPSLPARALKPLLSEGVITGEYEVLSEVAKDGPWLVVPQKDSAMSFRPCLVLGNWQKPQEAESESLELITTLEQASTTFYPGQKSCPFVPVLDSMASNLQHSGWDFFQQLDSNFSYLPMPIFEAWKALVRHPQALAVAFFKFRMRPNLIARLEKEFSVFKELMLISALKDAAKQYLAYQLALEVEAGVAQSKLEQMLSRLALSFPAFGANAQAFVAGKSMGAETRLPAAVCSFAHNDWYQELIRDHAEDRWPEHAGPDLERWHSQLPTPLLLIREQSGFRHAVMYLPIFSAAVAAGRVKFGDIFSHTGDTIFFLRKIRDFDTKWFNAMYEYSLSRFLSEQEQALEEAAA